MPPENTTKPRRLARQNKLKQVLKPYLPIPLILLALLCAFLTVKAIKEPAQTEQVLHVLSLEQEVSFDYGAHTISSVLYPTPVDLGPQKIYLLHLIDQFKIDLSVKIKAPQDQAVAGTGKVLMRLVAGDYWFKDYLLSPETSFKGRGEFMALELPLVLPYQELLAFGARVSEEAKTGPGTYTVQILPILKAGFDGEGAGPVNEFEPQFNFNLSNLQLVPEGLPKDRYDEINAAADSVQSHSVDKRVMQAVPNKFLVFGVRLPLAAARAVLGTLTFSCGLLAALLTLNNIKTKPLLGEAALIKKRYGGRLAQVQTAGALLGNQIIQMASFQALVNIADEEGKIILYTDTIDGEKRGHTYYLPDGGLTYLYSIKNEV